MTLDRETIEALLPCYLCGDLPPGVAARIDAAVAADPTLQARLDTLGRGRDACNKALALLRDDLPDLGDLELDLAPLQASAGPAVEAGADPTDPASETAPTAAGAPLPASLPAPTPPRPAASPLPGLGLGLAAAAALIAFGLSQGSTPPAEVGFLAQHDHAAHASAPLLSATDGPGALKQAFRDAGVPPALAHAPDLSAWGFALVGGVVHEGAPGVSLVYEKDGQRYVCQIYANLRTQSRPDRMVEVQGVRVRGFQDGSRGIVEWSAGGRTCLFSGPGDVSALMAVVTDRIRRSRGGAQG